MTQIYFRNDEHAMEILQLCVEHLDSYEGLNVHYYGHPYNAYGVTFNIEVQMDYFDDVIDRINTDLQHYLVNNESEVIQL